MFCQRRRNDEENYDHTFNEFGVCCLCCWWMLSIYKDPQRKDTALLPLLNNP